MTYLLAAEPAEWWMPFVPVLGAAALIAIVSGAVAMVLLLRDVRVYVLPHFLPPGPGEEDVSLPAQVSKIKADLKPTNGDLSSISARVDKARKLAEEVREDLAEHRDADAADRAARQAEQDVWKQEVRGELVTIKGSIRHVHGRIDSVVVGNPEFRPRGRVSVQTPEVLDVSTAAAWAAALDRYDLSGYVTIDMTGTVFCDSNGLGALIKAADKVSAAGGIIRAANLAPNIRRLIEQGRLEDLLGLGR